MKVTTKTEKTVKWYMRLKKSEIQSLIKQYCKDLGVHCDSPKYLYWDKHNLSLEAYNLYLETLK
jgi:hypothetical protein